jgi:ABC-2 type transport system permease protein
MTSGILLVGCYFVNALSQIDDSLDPVAKLLPFRYYRGGLAIEGMNWGEWGVMLGISALFIIAAWWRFERRDIRVGGEGGWGLPAFSLGKRKAAAGD